MICSISVIIPTLGNIENLNRLMKSTVSQHINQNNYEVLIVVNGLIEKKDVAALDKWSMLYSEILKVYFISEKGVNIARNFGLSRAKFSVALFLDDDCELSNPHFLEEHIRLHSLHEQIFAIGGAYLLPASAKYFDQIYNYIQIKWFISGVQDTQLSSKTQYLLGGNFSIKLETVKDRKLKFDENILYGGSEYEFFRKANIIGLKMLTNGLDVIHHTQESLLSLTRKIFKQGRGKAYIDGKYKIVSQDFVKEKKISNRSGGVVDRTVRLYFNYIFWMGYYFYQKKYFRIFYHIVKHWSGSLNMLRFEILSKISQQISSKKEKGDRF